MTDLQQLWPIDPITDEEYRVRTDAVRKAAVDESLDAILAYSTAKITANVRYLTWYYTRFAGHQHTREHGYYMFGACAALVPVDGEPLLRTDALWDAVRAAEMSEYSDVAASTSLGGDIGRVIAARGLTRVGVDNWFLFPAADYLAMIEAAPGVEFVPTLAISHVRAVKSPAELDATVGPR